MRTPGRARRRVAAGRQGARIVVLDERGDRMARRAHRRSRRAPRRGSWPMPPASAISFAMRSSARPEPYCSMQPRAPQPHGRPSGTTRRWPISPAAPNPPRSRRPSVTTAPPTPVPMVSRVMSVAPRPAPKRYSAQPAAFASLSIVMSMPGQQLGEVLPERLAAPVDVGGVVDDRLGVVDEAGGGDPGGRDVLALAQRPGSGRRRGRRWQPDRPPASNASRDGGSPPPR